MISKPDSSDSAEESSIFAAIGRNYCIIDQSGIDTPIVVTLGSVKNCWVPSQRIAYGKARELRRERPETMIFFISSPIEVTSYGGFSNRGRGGRSPPPALLLQATLEAEIGGLYLLHVIEGADRAANTGGELAPAQH